MHIVTESFKCRLLQLHMAELSGQVVELPTDGSLFGFLFLSIALLCRYHILSLDLLIESAQLVTKCRDLDLVLRLLRLIGRVRRLDGPLADSGRLARSWHIQSLRELETLASACSCV